MGGIFSSNKKARENPESLLCKHCDDDSIDATPAELLFRINYDREKPETSWQKFAWSLCVCCRCCYTFCCPPCPPCIVHKMAFHPPTPTYDLVQFGSKANDDYRLLLGQNAKDFQRLFYPKYHSHNFIRGFYVQSGRWKSRLACIYLSNRTYGSSAAKTVLFSHANAEDTGLTAGRMLEMSWRVSVNVVAYDYSGYGRSTGCCSEANLYDDIERVYEFMTKRMKIPWQQIIAIGTSLGSAATIHLASRHEVSAVVLRGSFASALRTLCPETEETSCIDSFVNVDKIGKISCPTLFVHGEEDKMFGLEHVKQLRSRCPGARGINPVIIEGSGHVDFDRFDEYWEGLRKFVQRKVEVCPTPKRSRRGHGVKRSREVKRSQSKRD